MKSLFEMVSRFGNVFRTTRLKSFLSDNIDKSIRSQVRNHFSTKQKVDYNGVAWYAQALGDTHRAYRRQPSAVINPVNDKTKRRMLKVDYSSPSEKTANVVKAVGFMVHLLHIGPASTSVSPSSTWTSTFAASTARVSKPAKQFFVPDQRACPT